MDMELRKLVGKRIIVMGPKFVDHDKLQSVKLLAVEEAGIWIESEEAVDKILGRLQKKATAAALGFFIPWGQITTIVAGFEPAGTE